MAASRYTPPSQLNWQGRIDGDNSKRMHEVMQLNEITKWSTEKIASPNTYGLIGFACDEGIKRNQGKPGASQGPLAFRKAFAGLPEITGIRLIDFGDITCEDNNLEAAQTELANAVTLLRKTGIHPLVIGGGHEVAWGHYQGIAAANPNKEISIINFDSHFDLRSLLENGRGSSGTSFLQMANALEKQKLAFHYTCFGIQRTGNTKALFDVADKLKVKYVLADDFHLGEAEPAIELLDDILNQSDLVYATICLDVFAAPYAPGVSAPQPLGLYPWHVIPLLRMLAESGKVISLDIAELSPPRDQHDMTSQLAASLLHNYLAFVPLYE